MQPLMDHAGLWHGTSILQDPENGIAETCDSSATLTPVLQGKFIRLDYTWSYRDEPQEGSILISSDPKSSDCKLYWADTWHMGNVVMTCEGSHSEAGICARGSYAAPPGPDWGWRIDLDYGNPDEVGLRMFNIWPDGREELAVEAQYGRS